MGRCNTVGLVRVILCLDICKHILFCHQQDGENIFLSFSSLFKKNSRAGFALHLGFLPKRQHD